MSCQVDLHTHTTAGHVCVYRYLPYMYIHMLAMLYPGCEGRPGTNCTHMRQHFCDIFRKIVCITLSKYMVMPWKKSVDRKTVCQARTKPASKQYHSWNISTVLLYSFSSLTGCFTFTNEHNSVVLSSLTSILGRRSLQI